MSQKSLSNPTIEVNDDTIAIVPNSFSYKPGKGDKGVKAQSSGGDGIEVVITENAETKKSMVKFKLYNTSRNLQLVKDWSAQFSNTIRASEGDISESFRDMVITAEPERMIGAEGELEIEWEGAPTL
jgi:hypothetical protein